MFQKCDSKTFSRKDVKKAGLEKEICLWVSSTTSIPRTFSEARICYQWPTALWAGQGDLSARCVPSGPHSGWATVCISSWWVLSASGHWKAIQHTHIPTLLLAYCAMWLLTMQDTQSKEMFGPNHSLNVTLAALWQMNNFIGKPGSVLQIHVFLSSGRREF